MTRTRYRIYDNDYPHFMTCTIVGWLPVFTRPEAVQIVFDSWDFLRKERGLQLYGYVVLENHLHLIASAPDLANAIKSFKMYTARQIIDLLKSHSARVLLKQLRALKLSHKAASEYQVWEEGSQPKQISNDEMMDQKLDYIHDNPVKRGYVDDPVHWRYSSARLCGPTGIGGGDYRLALSSAAGSAANETEFQERAFPNGVWERLRLGAHRVGWVKVPAKVRSGLCSRR
jgi:REP element-mobilizing transposase RayT